MSTINLNNALDAQLSGAANTAAAAPAGGSNAFAELESTDFVRILVEELSNQDPFDLKTWCCRTRLGRRERSSDARSRA